jgi:poly(ADP-ribose) glycohydrolase ARH3
MEILESKFLGSMIGSALGDAIGELAFDHRNIEDLSAVIEKSKQLRYTDDTAMAIGIAQSIIKVRGIDQQHLGDTFATNYRHEPWRGYAIGPPLIFDEVQSSGKSYTEVARSLFAGTGSFGNGAAMRIAPVGLFFYDSPNLYRQASLSALVTHAHPVGIDGAAVLAYAVAQTVNQNPKGEFPRKKFIQNMIDFSKEETIKRKMVLVKRLREEKIPSAQVALKLGQSVAVQESMPFAVYSFLRHPKSFADCLFTAILHGGDRDTLGAMAGAVSGTYLGIKAIPKKWLDKLENRDKIEQLALDLLEAKM